MHEPHQVRAIEGSAEQATGFGGRRVLRRREAQADHFDAIATLLVIADRAPHERRDANQFLLGARSPDRLAVRPRSGDPVDHDREADAPDLRLLADESRTVRLIS